MQSDPSLRRRPGSKPIVPAPGGHENLDSREWPSPVLREKRLLPPNGRYAPGEPLQHPGFQTDCRLPRSSASAMQLRSEEHTSELQSHLNLVCRLLLEKKKNMATENDSLRQACIAAQVRPIIPGRLLR